MNENNSNKKVFLAGAICLIVGGALGFYLQFYSIEQGVLDTIESEKIAHESFLVGQVDSIFPIQSSLNLKLNTQNIELSVDSQTKIYKFSDEDIPKEIMLKLSDIKVGQFINVLSNEPVGGKAKIYAKEILAL